MYRSAAKGLLADGTLTSKEVARSLRRVEGNAVPASERGSDEPLQLPVGFDNRHHGNGVRRGVVLVEHAIAADDDNPATGADLIGRRACFREVGKEAHPLINPLKQPRGGCRIIGRDVAADTGDVGGNLAGADDPT